MRAQVASTLILCAALLVTPASAGEAVEPTALEKFALHPDTVVAVSREIGSLTSVDSTVTVTALVAATRADATQRMRGS